MTNDLYMSYQDSVERLLFVNVNSPLKLFSVIPDPLSRRVLLSCQWSLLSEIGMATYPRDRLLNQDAFSVHR